MDNIEKFLKKLSSKDLDKVLSILVLIGENNLLTLDIKKLKNAKDLFRVRSGNIRIVFRKHEVKNMIVDINFRKEIYKK